MARDGGPRGRKRGFFNGEGVMEFFHHLMAEKPLLPFLIPLVLIAWSIERWVFSLSNWVPLAVAVWATLQVCFLFQFPSIFFSPRFSFSSCTLFPWFVSDLFLSYLNAILSSIGMCLTGILNFLSLGIWCLIFVISFEICLKP